MSTKEKYDRFCLRVRSRWTPAATMQEVGIRLHIVEQMKMEPGSETARKFLEASIKRLEAQIASLRMSH